MTNFTLGLVFVFGGALLTTVACGSDDDDSGSSDAGTSSTSKGGSMSGGSTAKGGSSSGGSSSSKGGMTGRGGEDNGSGGEDNGGGGETGGGGDNGFGGFPSFGGAFNNPESCPDDPPMSGDNCTLEADAQNGCLYPNSYCICGQNGEFGGIGNWICIAGGNNECPQEPPSDGEPCEGPILGDCDGCFCPGGQDGTWLCP